MFQKEVPRAGSKSTLVVVAIVLPIAISAMLLFIGCCWWRRRQTKRKNLEDVQEVNDSSNVLFFLKKK